ncbi:hypothetical protein NVIE_0298 [Nitrososphaera viennensis EN76]|uniref:Uncharacterized protein n=1 Tax=Nitrososphaera viennensis EN76 TaxID=926571 RepID=A0A060HCN2_9ARCH|nr:hypothetical protein NVIE_0298 [Nitrososphaera viennensis EN76]
MDLFVVFKALFIGKFRAANPAPERRCLDVHMLGLTLFDINSNIQLIH